MDIAVVQTLAHNSTATLSVIKDYLINKLQRESQQIEEDERKIRQYREETAHLRSEIQELKTRWATWRQPRCRFIIPKLCLNYWLLLSSSFLLFIVSFVATVAQ